MSIRADLKKLKTGNRDLRKFGLMVGGAFVFDRPTFSSAP
jgi:hypothetical protein